MLSCERIGNGMVVNVKGYASEIIEEYIRLGREIYSELSDEHKKIVKENINFDIWEKGEIDLECLKPKQEKTFSEIFDAIRKEFE
jgi:hypothetical protein